MTNLCANARISTFTFRSSEEGNDSPLEVLKRWRTTDQGRASCLRSLTTGKDVSVCEVFSLTGSDGEGGPEEDLGLVSDGVEFVDFNERDGWKVVPQEAAPRRINNLTLKGWRRGKKTNSSKAYC